MMSSVVSTFFYLISPVGETLFWRGKGDLGPDGGGLESALFNRQREPPTPRPGRKSKGNTVFSAD